MTKLSKELKEEIAKRTRKAINIIKQKNSVLELGDSSFVVKSEGSEKGYRVKLNPNECDCYDWKHRARFHPNQACKHVIAAKLAIKFK